MQAFLVNNGTEMKIEEGMIDEASFVQDISIFLTTQKTVEDRPKAAAAAAASGMEGLAVSTAGQSWPLSKISPHTKSIICWPFSSEIKLLYDDQKRWQR